MNSKFIFVLSLLLISLPINAQEGWFWQNPLPQGNHLTSVYFIDRNQVGQLDGVVEIMGIC